MMNKYKLTVIAEVIDEEEIVQFLEHLKTCIGKIPCEFFLVGPKQLQSDLNIDIFRDKNCDIEIIDSKDGMPMGLNTALDKATGDIVHITKTNCRYESDGIKLVMKYFNEEINRQIVCLEGRGMNVNGQQQRILWYKLEREKGTITINLDEQHDDWCPALFGHFFKRDLISDLSFRPELKYEYRREFLSKAYARCHNYRMIYSPVVMNDFPDNDYYNYHPIYDSYWYIEELRTLSKLMLDPETTEDIQKRFLMDFIRIQFAANRDVRNKNILNDEELDVYIDEVKKIFGQLDDSIICMELNNNIKRLPYLTNKVFMYIKYGTDRMEVVPELIENNFVSKDEYQCALYNFVTASGAAIANSDMITANIRAINYKDGMLVFDALLKNSYFDTPENTIVKIIGPKGERYEIKEDKVYSLWKFFGKTVYREMTFQFSIPVENGKRAEYSVVLEYKGIELPLHCKFGKTQSRIRDVHKHNFWEIDGHTFKYDAARRKLVISKSNPLKRFGNEVSFWIDIAVRTKNKKRGLVFIALRILYYITKPYYGRKNIWMTFDQLFKGGDNGEYFYRYVSEHGDSDQTIYYVINKDTPEYKHLKEKYNTVLVFSSLKHKLISLHTNIVFTTRVDVALYAGFAKSASVYFRNLMNFEVVCLQHGLSIQQIAQYQNRVYDNLKYYFCVSKYEIANLSKPIYGFEDKSVLVLTGAPRYDGLGGEVLKQVIIAPTWRRNVTSGTNKKGYNHEYSSNFKETEYFKIYNRLINDKKLIDCAKTLGYKLIYLIHPILSPQIDDFDKNDYLEIVPGSEINYEKILSESALMLTDHSGIMYDFAYQRKPLVYYHPESLPPQYAEGGLNYETMGFGPVCKEHTQVVEALCRLMERDCAIDDKYKERIDDFFEFDDQNNCERVYKAAKEFEKSLR